MNKRPGQTRVTTEVGFCSFCARPRNLRREERQLGALVRTIVTCESCHRTLSSSMGMASDEPAAAAPATLEKATPARRTETEAKPAKRETAAAKKQPAARKATKAKKATNTAGSASKARPAAKAAKPATRSAPKGT